MRKKALGLFALLLGVLLALAYLGPRSGLVAGAVQAAELPADLDRWLSEQEARVPGLRPGTEKKILWAKGAGTPTSFSLVYVHGFSASRREVSPVIEKVAAELGVNVFFTRLRGHGQTGQALAEARSREWLEDTEEAFQVGQRIGSRVVLIGTSTGGILALWAALEHPNVAAVVLMSPNFSPKDGRAKMVLWPGGLALAKLLTSPERSWEPENDLQKEIWTYRYPLEAVVPMMETVEFVSTLDLSRLSAPVLGIYTPHDGTIDASLVPKRFEKIGSAEKRLVRLDQTTEHVLAGDATSPATNDAAREAIVRFLAPLIH